MIISFIPPGGAPDHNDFLTWNDMGKWYDGLTGERMAATPPIKQETSSITSKQANTLAKMQAVAEYIQNQIRYIAIELGIGGWQPHSAADVLAHRYGDCKDKATLVVTAFSQLGIKAHLVLINSSVRESSLRPASLGAFNHAIVALDPHQHIVGAPDFLARHDDGLEHRQTDRDGLDCLDSHDRVSLAPE